MHEEMFSYAMSADNIDPYYRLANAIILQAVRDYRMNKMNDHQLKKFLLGEWFLILTNTDGEYLYKNLVKERGEKHDRNGIKGKN